MKCPHCLVAFHDKPQTHAIEADIDGGWMVWWVRCPTCKKLVISLLHGKPVFKDAIRQILMSVGADAKLSMVYPKSASRPQCAKQVPKLLAEDYNEACLVLVDSPKASAALSRRCLQHLLREAAKVKPSDLSREIQEVLDSRSLRSDIAEALDAVRAIGNFAAHPIKSQHTGEVMPVEPNEAEWNLDVLEALFDFYFVNPAILRAKKDALNKKMIEAGKPTVK